MADKPIDGIATKRIAMSTGSRSVFPFSRAGARAPSPAPSSADADAPFLQLDVSANHNQRVVLQAVRTRGRVSRTDLALITGLTKPTIVNLSQVLVQAGLVHEQRVSGEGRGRPSRVLELDPDGAYSIGLNVDRDHLTLIALDLGGKVRGRVSDEMAFASPADAGRWIAKAWDRLAQESGIPANRIVGLGVAFPDELGSLPFPGKPPGYDAWVGTSIKSLLAPIFAGPTFVENDAVAAAIGEAQFGHGLEAPSFVYVLISVLLGGGIVINGNYFRGEHGRSGEIGFMEVTSSAGGSRSLQDVVSIGALSQRLKDVGIAIHQPDDLCALTGAGAAILEAWLDEASVHLTTIFAQIARFIDPDAIFLGGRLPDSLLDRLAELCRSRRDDTQPGPALQIKRAKLSADAPAIGAAILPFQSLLFPSRTTIAGGAGVTSRP